MQTFEPSSVLPADRSVLVIGGGLAGLATASALATRGFHVTLLESRRQLGGRTTSFRDPTTGEVLDNCQHVSMGCCTNLREFCRRVGIARWFADHPVLYFQDEAGRVSEFRTSQLPVPLHQLPSFLGASFLTLPEKLRIGWATSCLLRQRTAPPGTSFLDWLKAHRQTPRTCQRYWSVILTGALNESLDRMDYDYARQVLVEGFLGNRRASVVQIPTVPLAELYGDALRRWLLEKEVRLCLGTAAGELVFEGERVIGCRARRGELYLANDCVLAVPFRRVAGLLPAAIKDRHELFANLSQLQAVPITCVHLRYDRPVMDYPHLVTIGRVAQWLFRRPLSQPGDGLSATEGQSIQVVISASRELAAFGKRRILELITEELRDILPATRSAELLHHRVVTERSATFSVVPGVDRWRPTQSTPLQGLWLAGDYTRTGWPATMEGAVRSGHLAAEGILARHGSAQRVLQPALPVDGLARWLIR